MNKDKKTDEEEILLPPYTRLLRVYTYQPYTVHRVKRMLKEIGCVAENINQGVIQQIKHCLFRHIKTGLL